MQIQEICGPTSTVFLGLESKSSLGLICCALLLEALGGFLLEVGQCTYALDVGPVL